MKNHKTYKLSFLLKWGFCRSHGAETARRVECKRLLAVAKAATNEPTNGGGGSGGVKRRLAPVRVERDQSIIDGTGAAQFAIAIRPSSCAATRFQISAINFEFFETFLTIFQIS